MSLVQRRQVLIALVTLLTAPVGARAQKTYRIGYLWPADRSSSAPLTEAFLQGLRELDYAEGRNIVIDWRFAEGRSDKLRDLAVELVRLKPDLIVAVSPQAVEAVKAATSTIPVVMVAVADPVTYGFVKSLARPGGNVTGTAFILPEISTKRLELLKEIVPQLSRVAVLWNASNPYRALDFKVLEAGARALGVALQSLEARDPDDLDRLFEVAERDRAGGLLTLEDPFTVAHRTRIADLALKHRLPAIYAERILVQSGGLMSYGPILLENFRRGAAIVDKILKGAKPADLPIEQPTHFELVVNMKTARALDLTLPQSILARADRVIE